MAALAVYRGDQFLRQVEIGKARTRIGRGAANEVVLEDPEKRVSRTHAEILYEGSSYVVVDLDSQNGVWIDDRRVKRSPLPVDVPVTIGPYKLRLIPDPEPEPAADSPGTLVGTEGEERLVEPTELVGSGVLIPPAQAKPTPSSGVQAKPAASSAVQAKPAPSSGVQAPPDQASAVQAKPASTQAKTKESSPTHAAPARGAVASAPWPRKRVIMASVAAAAVVGVLAVVLIVANSRRAPVDDVGTVLPPPPPPGPTDQERFDGHYAKAQAHIAEGNKVAAATENGEALKLLPSEPRGLQQQADIVAMVDVPVTPIEEPPVVTPPTAAPTVPPSGAAAVASSLRVAPRDGETVSARNARERLARTHLDDAKKALADRRYAQAIDLFQAALSTSDRPDYGTTKDEARTLQQSARETLAADEAAQKRANAQRLVEQAKALANSDIVGAVRRLREARTLDPQVAGPTEQLLNGLQEEARTRGEGMLTAAKNYDAFKKFDDAIREFDKAVQLLELVPGGHKDLASARQRSAELKKRK